ncbi:MAG: primosomal protein N' [Candidatus Spechtbacterales bacterium]
MYIYLVIPLTNIPRSSLQKPVYYSSEKFELGQLVEVPLASRLVPAVIVKRTQAERQKLSVKKSPYSLKSIRRGLLTKPLLSKQFLKLAEYLAEYYFVSAGLMLKRMLPPFFAKPTKPLLSRLEDLADLANGTQRKTPQKVLLITRDREKYYKDFIKNGPSIFIVPKYLHLELLPNSFKKGVSIIGKNTSATEWRDIWINAYEGTAKTVVGTRSAIFTPVKNLENIIIEKENDSSHVSWDQHPKFSAPHVAELMSEIYGARLMEGDLIPSVSKWHKAKTERWKIVEQKNKSANCKIVNMKKELESGNTGIISKELKDKLKSLKKEQKALLFINRRGLSSALLCRDCGYIVKCSNCDSAVVLHKGISYKLICHHCGIKIPPPRICPDCGSYRIKQLGGGTQLVVQEVQKILPGVKIARMDSDITKNTEDQKNILNNFKRGDYQVLVGTQMAVAENVLSGIDLIAVVMADSILGLPSYQAYEKVYEIIWRLKNMTKKEVVIQTYLPELELFKFINNPRMEEFFKRELEKRKDLKWPPFSHIIKLIHLNKDVIMAEREAVTMKRRLDTQLKAEEFKNIKDAAEILGPAPGYIPKIAEKYAWYILVKWPVGKSGKPKELKLRNKLLSIAGRLWQIEVDPADVV